ncbi:hypothetical protein [Natronincola ferrireducens]|uniref:Uncharacterized protein n=1 Tax=Natronincola ferrireducens TaxID=393762 RepID=A0A1G9CSG0_9FIRM|nr:hypothetical protein [Natronincola ferrireducens]SDK54586.1 hypothetical protein SAMN05660472_01544 [Natronincola ferrireducens]
MKPKQRMYIDARHEKFQLGNAKQVTYVIEEIDEDSTKQKIYEAIGPYTLKIEVVPNNKKVMITYYESIISPTYMDYQLQLKNLVFKREND